jgi:hypothetical protein
LEPSRNEIVLQPPESCTMRVHADELNRVRVLDLGQRLGEDVSPHVRCWRVLEGDRIDSCLVLDVMILRVPRVLSVWCYRRWGNFDGPLIVIVDNHRRFDGHVAQRTRRWLVAMVKRDWRRPRDRGTYVFRNCCVHMTDFVASQVAISSASHEKSATNICVVDLHDTWPPQYVISTPVVDFRVSTFSAQSASACARGASKMPVDAPYLSPWSMVPARFVSTRWSACQCLRVGIWAYRPRKPTMMAISGRGEFGS